MLNAHIQSTPPSKCLWLVFVNRAKFMDRLNEDQTQNLKVNNHTNIDTIRKYFLSLVNSLVTPKMLFLTHVIKFRNRFSFRWEMIPLLNNKLCNKILDKIICIQRNIQFIAEFWCRYTERKTNEFWFLVQFWPPSPPPCAVYLIWLRAKELHIIVQTIFATFWCFSDSLCIWVHVSYGTNSRCKRMHFSYFWWMYVS